MEALSRGGRRFESWRALRSSARGTSALPCLAYFARRRIRGGFAGGSAPAQRPRCPHPHAGFRHWRTFLRAHVTRSILTSSSPQPTTRRTLFAQYRASGASGARRVPGARHDRRARVGPDSLKRERPARRGVRPVRWHRGCERVCRPVHDRVGRRGESICRFR